MEQDSAQGGLPGVPGSSQQEMADALPIMVWTATPDGMVDYLSDFYFEYTGLQAVDLDNAGWLDGVHPDDHEPTLAVWAEALRHGHDYSTEFRIFHAASGSYRWHLVSARPHRDARGQIHKWYGITIDTSQQHRENALRSIENRILDQVSQGLPLKQILETITLAVDDMLPGVRSSILLVESGLLRHGAAPNLPEVYNQSVDGVSIGEGMGSCGTAALRGKQVIVADIAGDPLWQDYRELAQTHGLVACWSTPVVDAQGHVLATFALYPDRTGSPDDSELDLIHRIGQFVLIAIERSRQLAHLESSEKRYRSLFNLVPVSLWDQDWTGVRSAIDDLREQGVTDIEAWFREHPQALGETVRTIRTLAINQATLEIFDADDLQHLMSSMETIFTMDECLPGFLAYLRGETLFETESELQTVTGRRVHVLLSMTFPPPGSDSNRALVSIMDITRRREAEEQLQQSQRLDAVGKLTGGVAHDFNNLLTVILGNTELLMDSLRDDQELYTLAEMTSRAAERGAELTRRLLAFSRRQPLEPRATDVNRQIGELIPLLRRTLGETIDVSLAQANSLWPAMIDPGQLENALINLAINARDAMPEGGQLAIETANITIGLDGDDQDDSPTPGEYILVEVSDTGTGMPAHIRERAFEPFFTTKEVGKGTGLGLSMVYGFAKQSSGHIRIDSQPDQGTVIRLYLPRAPEEEAEETSPSLQTSSGISGKERILLVEDDKLVRQHAEKQLSEAGYKVQSSADGRSALDILQQDPDFDLLFTDVIMPGMTGPQLVTEARQLVPDLAVLFTSGYNENAISQDEPLDADIPLLVKPYRRESLERMIRQVLDESDDF